ncbi:MAG: hypothetical protein QOC82_3094 [Frankiaceae bacterium]|nr:hypothetical protein [Frankiaceae bacterium]
MHIKVLLSLAAVVAAMLIGSLGGSTPHASALPLCYGATVSTPITGTDTVGPVCVPYPGAAFCDGETVSLPPFGDATVYACIPAPLQGGVSTPGA